MFESCNRYNILDGISKYGLLSDKWCNAVESFSNLLRDGKHLKVANFRLSLPKYDSASENGSENVGSNRSTDSLTTKLHKGSSCKLSITRFVEPKASRIRVISSSVSGVLYLSCW